MTSSQQNPVVTYAVPDTYIAAVSVTGGPNNCSAALSTDRDTVVITATGIEENALQPVFGIRQGASGKNFIIDSDRSRFITVRLYEISGRDAGIVFEGEVDRGANHLLVEAGGLSNSVYLLEARSAGERSVCRYIPVKP